MTRIFDLWVLLNHYQTNIPILSFFKNHPLTVLFRKSSLYHVMSSSSFQITPLEGHNRAAEWKIAMGRVLSYEQYTYVTETKKVGGRFVVQPQDRRVNHEAKFIILTSVSSSIQPLIEDIDSAPEMWNRLIDTYVYKFQSNISPVPKTKPKTRSAEKKTSRTHAKVHPHFTDGYEVVE